MPFEMHSYKLLLSRNFHSRSVCIIDICRYFPLTAARPQKKITPILKRLVKNYFTIAQCRDKVYIECFEKTSFRMKIMLLKFHYFIRKWIVMIFQKMKRVWQRYCASEDTGSFDTVLSYANDTRQNDRHWWKLSVIITGCSRYLVARSKHYQLEFNESR